MLMAGIVLMAVSVMVTGSATFLEWRRREPLWALLMKIGPCLFGIGECSSAWAWYHDMRRPPLDLTALQILIAGG